MDNPSLFRTCANSCIVAIVIRLHLSRGGLLDPDPGPARLRTFVLGTASSIGVFAVSIPIGFWSPTVAEYFWLVLIPLRLVLNRLTQP